MHCIVDCFNFAIKYLEGCLMPGFRKLFVIICSWDILYFKIPLVLDTLSSPPTLYYVSLTYNQVNIPF